MPQRGDKQVVGLARSGGLNLLGQVCSQAAMLLVTVLLARRLGRGDVGRYAQAFAFLSLLGLLSLSGLRAGLTRFVAVHLAAGQVRALRGTVRIGIALSTGSAALLGLALFLLAPRLAHGPFHDPALALPLEVVGLVLPAATFTDAALAATQGFTTMKPFALVGLVFEPLLRFGLSAALVAAGAGLRGALIALAVSNLAAAVMAALALRRLLGGIGRRGPLAAGVAGGGVVPADRATRLAHAGRPGRLLLRARVAWTGRGGRLIWAGASALDRGRARMRELLEFSMLSWGASLASTGLIWADTILIGALRSSAEVGVYNVATRLVTLATFVMPAINGALGPRIADLHQRGDTDSLRRAYGVATSWILRLSLPAFVALLIFPSELLRMFGRGFGEGAAVTTVLALGKLADAGTGPCGLMLNMSGRPLWSALDNGAALALNVGLNLLLIPSHGILGAAVAWALALALVNTVRVAQVWWAMRMLPFDLGVAKGLVAGAGALAAGLLARRWMAVAAIPLTTVFGLLQVGAVYLGLLVILGLGAEDRLVMRSLLRRLGT
jgi:O-antigen/teichoic acid export membrane protein